MKDFRVLKLLDRLRWLYEKFGVNYPIMRKILQMKLIMDQRRVSAVQANSKNDDKDNKFTKALIVYGVTGLVIMAFILPSFPMFFKMNLVYGMVIFMVMAAMISDYSTVLLDLRDKNILLPKPIDKITINAAKITHIIIYLSAIMLAIAGPSLVAGTIKHGWIFGGIYFALMFFVLGFIIFFTSLLYFMILKFFDGEKLKDVINYFQITLSIVMIIGYQLIGNIFVMVNMEIVFEPKWWIYFLPSAWFAAPYSLFLEKSSEIQFIYFSILGIVIPVAVFIIYFKRVVPYFETYLLKLSSGSEKQKKSIEQRGARYRKLVSIICSDRMESIFYRFTQHMIANERKLKLKLYPNLGLAAALPLIIIIKSFRFTQPLAETYAALRSSKWYFYIYLTAALLATGIYIIHMSEKYKGGWIYRVLPLKTPGPICTGALKGFVMKYILPIFAVSSGVFLMFYGWRILPDILLMFLNMILLILLIFKLSKKELPFTRDFQHQSENISLVFGSMGFCGASAGLHYLLKKLKYGIPINILVVALVIAILWRSCKRVTWKDVLETPKSSL
ncbi:MAG: hypothetical protein ACOYVK_22285 [Bacillota bacterium]